MNRPKVCAALLAVGLLLPATRPAPADQGKDAPDEIAELIRKLGDNDYEVREAAERRLIELGDAAIPALREARNHSDAEIAHRAQRAYKALVDLSPAAIARLRQMAQQAFGSGNYDAMAALYARLARLPDPAVDDLLKLGHARQLAGKWKEAVDAYALALKRLDAILADPRIPVPGNARGARGAGFELRVQMGRGGQAIVQRGGVVRNEHQTAQLRQQRAGLLLLMGRIQRDELGDPAAAADTFAKATQGVEVLTAAPEQLVADYKEYVAKVLADGSRQYDHSATARLMYPLLCLKELAAAQERLGRASEAVATWSRVNLVAQRYQVSQVTVGIEALGRLIQKLPAGAPLPETPTLIVLTPQEPTCSLDLAGPATLARSYRQPSNLDTPFWRFAFSPPPGMEFATVEFACDIEQNKLRHGGQFRCWAMAEGPDGGQVAVGRVSWPKEEPPGRKTVTERFDVPPGAGPLYISTGRCRDAFTVHGVKAAATFRPRAASDIAPPAQTWIQNQVLPPGGTLTCDGEAMLPESATTDLAPGRHVFQYASADGTRARRCEVKLAPGARHGLFLNLDSPFDMALTTLRRLGEHPPARIQMVRLPDGRWLAAWHADERVWLSASRDLVTWDAPWVYEHCSVFNTIGPSLIVDHEGTVHMAYFQKRTSLEWLSSGGYLMWLSRSKDGRTWSRPMPVEAGIVDGWPLSGIRMLRDPKGKYWIFWGQKMAAADSPAAILTLDPINIDLENGQCLWNPSVAFGDDGCMHMVFDDFGRGIYYANSTDGRQWSKPVKLIGGEEPDSGKDPQLLLKGDQAAIIYQTNKGGWLARGTLGPEPAFGDPVKITHHVIPLNASRPTVTRDGKLVLLAGSHTVWRLQCNLDDALPPPAE